jgi:hypothetical protein
MRAKDQYVKLSNKNRVDYNKDNAEVRDWAAVRQVRMWWGEG